MPARHPLFTPMAAEWVFGRCSDKGRMAFSLDGRDKFRGYRHGCLRPNAGRLHGLLACFCVTGCIEDKRTLVDSDRQMVDDAGFSDKRRHGSLNRNVRCSVAMQG